MLICCGKLEPSGVIDILYVVTSYNKALNPVPFRAMPIKLVPHSSDMTDAVHAFNARMQAGGSAWGFTYSHYLAKPKLASA